MGQSKSTTSTSIPGWQRDFITDTVFPVAQGVADAPFQQYSGPFAPQMSDMSMQAADVYGGLANMTPQDYAAQTAANMNPYQQNVIDASLAQMDRSAGQARTGMEAGLIGSGAFGSRGEVARGEFEAGVQGNRDALIANMMQQGYGQAMNATQQQLANRMAGAGGLGGLGGQATALAGQQLAGQYGEFMREQNYPMQQLGALMGVGGMNAGSTSTQTSTPGTLDYITAGAGLASGLGGLAAFSDRRLKKNVVKVGERSGLNVYKWDWTDEGAALAHPDQPKIGFMADEVAEVAPDAVWVGADGYQRVDYGALSG